MASKICLDPDMLDVLMPMHALVSADGIVRHAGPTLAKIHPGRGLIGRPFFELFEPRRRAAPSDIEALRRSVGSKVHLRMRDPARTPAIGVAVKLAGGDGVLVNLSFGIAAVEAIARFNLAGSDFAATDLTLELLYLVEANAAAMDEARKTGERLAGARNAAQAEALQDRLTGLSNRRALDLALERIVARDRPFTIMNVDLDYFKAVNDTLGHAAGDLVLESVARVLLEETRQEDVVARSGGDEFVIVFNDLTREEQLASIAARLIQRLERPIPCGDSDARISASIGIAMSSLYDRPDAVRMLQDADAALYESKRLGRARHTFFRPEPETAWRSG